MVIERLARARNLHPHGHAAGVWVRDDQGYAAPLARLDLLTTHCVSFPRGARLLCGGVLAVWPRK